VCFAVFAEHPGEPFVFVKHGKICSITVTVAAVNGMNSCAIGKHNLTPLQERCQQRLRNTSAMMCA
jgi:hypothetical protein